MIEWSIISMESQPSTGIVVTANWSCVAQENTVVAPPISGACVFPPPNENYTPYAQLTQDQVLDWVWSVGGVNKTTTENAANEALQAILTPATIMQPNPWA
jgi:hypothetical protein